MIDYQVSYKTGAAAFTVIAAGVTTTSYTAGSLTPNVIYSFKVNARTLAGLGLDSSEVAIRAASIPTVPAAPSTVVNTNVSVTITWAAPNDGGSPITSY